MTKLIEFFTAATYSSVCVEGKTYKKRVEDGEAIYLVKCKNGALRRLNTPAIQEKIDAAIIALAEIEAHREDELREWENITPEQVVKHDARVAFGIELKNKHGVDDVLTACHIEALEMNQVLDTWNMVPDLMVKHSTPYAMDAVHAEALEENKRFNWLHNRWCLFHSSSRLQQEEIIAIAREQARHIIEAEEEYNSQRQWKLEAIWKHTHRDYKGESEGVRSILVCRNGTISVPLECLTDKEIQQRSSMWQRNK